MSWPGVGLVSQLQKRVPKYAPGRCGDGKGVGGRGGCAGLEDAAKVGVVGVVGAGVALRLVPEVGRGAEGDAVLGQVVAH